MSEQIRTFRTDQYKYPEIFKWILGRKGVENFENGVGVCWEKWSRMENDLYFRLQPIMMMAGGGDAKTILCAIIGLTWQNRVDPGF